MAWDSNFIDEVKMQVNIVDVIGRVVELKKAGANYKGLCPFHSEKTPSFMVSEEKQIFNCFGCGEKGDVIKFVESYSKLPFVEAVESLCKDYGIKIPEKTFNKSSINLDKYYKINAMVGKFFYNSLGVKGNRGISYFHKRGITNETITTWGLGYAPASGHELTDYLRKEGVSDDDMVKLGLSAIGKNNELYDKYRDRVIFPIINTQGNVIGFGGRAIEDIKPKYLNSPESQVFLKKNNLFGLNITKKDISDNDKVVMVEGYMDVISLWQNGITNVAASLGTALTENQAKLISRYTKNVVLSYDSDNAGVAAAVRGIDVMSTANTKTKVLRITDGKDPDDFVKSHGKDEFNKLVQEAIPGTEFKLEIAKSGYDFNNDRDVLDYIERIVPILKSLSPVEQDIYIKKLAKEYGISEHAIQLTVQSDEKKNVYKNINNTRRNTNDDKYDDRDLKLELSFLILIMKNPRYIEKIKQDGIELHTPLALKIMATLEKLIENSIDVSGGIDETEIFKCLEPDEESTLALHIKSMKLGPVDETFYRETLTSYQLNQCKEKRLELLNDLAVAEKLNQPEEIDRVGQKIIEMDNRIKELTEGRNV